MGIQVGLDQLGTPLAEVEWVVVDLETTGIGVGASITEIGAVRVRDGEVVDEFQTLVDPGEPISPRITALTGITTSMVTGQPSIDAAYPEFARWAGLEDDHGFAVSDPPCVLVAHNASFDIGFLRRAARSTGHEWASPRVVDTLALARVALPRPLVRNHRLATLAGHFATSEQDRHRALGDARTTVEVLHGLIEVLAPLGVGTVEDMSTVGAPVPARRRRRVALADDLPRSPGVYRFLDAAGAPLYVGSATNLRSRVRSYFTASESRAKVRRMLDLAADVRVTATSTLLEARVEELRTIRALHPLFNSASTHQDQTRWVVVRGEGMEIVPVLATDLAPDALGPFRGASRAGRALEALRLTYADGAGHPLSQRRTLDPARLEELTGALRGEHCEVVDVLVERMSRAGEAQDYEGATRWRGLLQDYLHGLQRRADVLPVSTAARVVWAHHLDAGGWTLHSASWGRLLRTVTTPAHTSPLPWVDSLVEEETPPRPAVFLSGTTWEEARLLTGSLTSAGARLVHWEGTTPLAGAVGSPLARTQLLGRLEDAGRRGH